MSSMSSLLGSAVVPAEVSQVQAATGTLSSLGSSIAQAAQSGSFAGVLDAVLSAESALDGGGAAETGTPSAGGLATDQLLPGGFLGSPSSAGASGSLGGALGSPAGGGTVTGSQVVAEAEQFLGVPYRWGGTSPQTGFDCSGFVQYVYGQLGMSLPRTSEEQATVGMAVPSLAEAEPGDLVFFPGSDGTPSAPGHVGIYIGNGLMIDAPETGETVSIQPVGNPVAIRRVLPTNGIATDAASGGGGGSGALAALGVPPSLVPTFEQAATQSGVSASLLAAVAAQESGFDPNAVSSAGAEGIMQLMPGTAASLGVDPLDPAQAISGAAQLLAGYLQTYGGSLPLALAAYNAGPGAVAQYGGVPPYPQTQAYVTDILQRLQEVA
jgi:cell wall-associated NlpC family hydrolase